MKASSLPVALSLFWFLLLGAMGLFHPYFGLHLREGLGFSEREVGLVLAMIPLLGAISPAFWGAASDRTGSRRTMVAFLCLAASLSFWLLATGTTFGVVLATTALLAIFVSAVMPLTTALTLAALRDSGPGAFGYVRVWGTVGFMVTAVLAPRFLPADAGADVIAAPGPLFTTVAALLLVCAACAFLLPDRGDMRLRARPGLASRLLGHRPLRYLLIFSALAHFLTRGPIDFLRGLVTLHGGDMRTIGDMWLGMLLIEIPLVAFAGVSLRRLGPRGLLRMGLVSEGLRWILSGLAPSLPILMGCQLLHGVGVMGLLLGAPLYLDAVVPRESRSTGQALVAAAGMGVGGTLSNVGFGWIVGEVGFRGPYVVAGTGALVLGLAARRILPDPRRSAPSPALAAAAIE